jgi:hypothetical protein
MTPDRKMLIGRTFPPIKCVIDEENVHDSLNETYLYRFLTDWLHRPWDLRRTKIRFVANVFPNNLLTCKGTITRIYRENGEPRVDCQIWQENHKGEKTLTGEATFMLPERE